MDRKYWNRGRKRVHVTACPKCGQPVETPRSVFSDRDLAQMGRLCKRCEREGRRES